MIWLQTPPWGRWAIAMLIAAVSLWIEFRPDTMTPHPFAVAEIAAGTTVDETNTDTRVVPVGTFADVELGQVARVAIIAGDPILSSQLGEEGEAAPDGWWSMEMPLPLGARPGDAARIVLLDSDVVADALVIEDPEEDPLGSGNGLVAVEADRAADVARAAGEGRAVVMIASREHYRAAVLAAVIWGLIQGLTEFLPVSSSGHLVIIPAFLSELGVEVPVPSLAVSTVIHLGTLASVLIYYRREVMAVLQFRTNPEGRKLALLVGIGTIPAVIGLPLADEIEGMQQSVAAVGWQLVATGVILVIGQRVATGLRRLMDGRIPDAVVVGVAQAIALIPGISRSGVTIAAANLRKFEPSEAARFSFLLGIPAIAGAGFSQLFAIPEQGGFTAELAVAMVVAGVSGYLAIAFMMKSINRIGLYPFAIYCFIIGLATVAFF